MKSTMLILALLLCVSPYADAQNKGAKSGKKASSTELDKLLEQALASNPDVRLAEAQLREAEAVLNKAKMQVVQNVIGLYHRHKSIDGELESANRSLESAKIRFESGIVGAEDLRRAEVESVRTKEKHAVTSAEMDFVTGRYTLGQARHIANFAGSRIPSAADWTRRRIVASAPQKALLDRVVSLDPEFRFASQVQRAATEAKTSIIVDADADIDANSIGHEQRGLRVTSMSLRSLLQVLHDRFGVVSIVRDYGILICDASKAKPGDLVIP